MSALQLMFDCFKPCASCKIAKPHSEFTVDRVRRDGLNPYCRVCTRRRNRSHYRNNKGKESARKAKAYRENRERFLARNRRWRAVNWERERETNRRYYWANRERVTEWHKRYYETNKDVARAATARRRARMHEVLTIPFTPEQLAERWAYYGDLCWICGRPAEASDHVKPISKGGPHMLANLRPICTSCNSAKRDKWPYAPNTRGV